MTPDGTRLLVTNTADGRLEVFTLGGALPVHTASIPVGLEPVSVRARSNSEAWVANKISDTVSIVDLTARNVVATVAAGDEPCDVVFAGSPQRAYISLAQPNQVTVYDPSTLAHTATVNIQGKDIRALATDGTHVYAAIFESGNRSMILPQSIVDDPSGPYGGVNPPPNSGMSFNPPIAGGLPAPPAVSLIINREGTDWKDDNNNKWDALITWGLNTNDVAIIQTSNLAVTYALDLLNINMAIAVNPANGRVFTVGNYGPNEHRFVENALDNLRMRIASFDPNNVNVGNGVADLNSHLFATPGNPQFLKTSVTPAEQHMSISDPRGIVWKSDGSGAYISGMGSNNVIKASATGARLATIDVGQGPTGLALDTPRQRLYVWNRFEGSVSSIDTGTDTELGRSSLYDPTPAVIKTGRPFLYDAHLTSRLGNESCASCHVDANRDTEAWDLGDPAGSMKTLDVPCNTGVGPSNSCSDWHPMKGPMMTQRSRSASPT
jgi:YVTN family beta-propeller protein